MPPETYIAVGVQRALDPAIGLPRSSTNASLMLVFLMPADVRRKLHDAFRLLSRRPAR